MVVVRLVVVVLRRGRSSSRVMLSCVSLFIVVDGRTYSLWVDVYALMVLTIIQCRQAGLCVCVR
jgi:hypothetical protein